MGPALAEMGWRKVKLLRRQAWELRERMPADSEDEKADNKARADQAEKRAKELAEELKAAGYAEPGKCARCEGDVQLRRDESAPGGTDGH